MFINQHHNYLTKKIKKKKQTKQNPNAKQVKSIRQTKKRKKSKNGQRKQKQLQQKEPNTKEYHLFDLFVKKNCSFVHMYFFYEELFKRHLIVVCSKVKREQRDSAGKSNLNSIL